MSQPPYQEGHIPFPIPTAPKPCQTYYKLFGTLSSPVTPLIILHGGPGGIHDYLLSHTHLNTTHSIPIIFYDALGNGFSTRLPEKAGDGNFWTEQLFRDELDNLIDHFQLRERGFDLLGHSWGGMLGAAYASGSPRGLRRLVMLSAPADMRVWATVQGRLREGLEKEVEETLRRCEEEGRTAEKEYEEAMVVFYKKHLCKVDPWPVEVARTMGALGADPTVYGTMNGPSETYITGTIKDWTVGERLKDIKVPVLLVNGDDDEAQDECVEPYFWRLEKVRWVTIPGASHMSHLEQPEKYFEVVSQFLLPDKAAV